MRAAAAFAVIACLTGFPAAASAALPAAQPPTSAGLSAAGVRVGWPVERRREAVLVVAGEPLAVGVLPLRAGAAPARVTLLRVDGRGRPMRVLARRAVRAGTVSVTVPERVPARYALRLDVGERRFFSWLGAFPKPPPPGGRCRRQGPLEVSMTLDRTAVLPGEVFLTKLTNTGVGSAGTGYPYRLQRLADGGEWVEVPPPGPFILPMLYVACDGGALDLPARIPPDAVPGHYRILKDVTAGGGPGRVVLSAELDVLAP